MNINYPTTMYGNDMRSHTVDTPHEAGEVTYHE